MLSSKLKNGKSMKNSFALTKLPVIVITVAIMAAAFLFTGCGKKPKTQPPAAPPVVKQNATAPNAVQQPEETPTPVAPVVVPSVSTNCYTVGAPWNPQQINGRVRGWWTQHGHWPANFEEFAATSGIQIPPPPPGMKYMFDGRLHVRIVKAD